VRGAVVLARGLRLSPFFIGLTIVGFGTSTPELSTSLIAASRGAADLSVGNLVDSNIFNLAFILGLVSLLAPITLRFAVAFPQILWALAAAGTPYAALLNDGRLLGAVAGLAMLTGLCAYLAANYRAGRREPGERPGEDGEPESGLPAGRGAWRQARAGWSRSGSCSSWPVPASSSTPRASWPVALVSPSWQTV